jgi:hypothetical protein
VNIAVIASAKARGLTVETFRLRWSCDRGKNGAARGNRSQRAVFFVLRISLLSETRNTFPAGAHQRLGGAPMLRRPKHSP